MVLANFIISWRKFLKKRHVHIRKRKYTMKTQTTAVTAPVQTKTRKLSISPKALLISIAATGAGLSGTASAALDDAQVTAIQTEVLADVSTAVSAGFAVLAVVLASSIGFSLLGRFISKGANGG
jgi:hypothetical protein